MQGGLHAWAIHARGHASEHDHLLFKLVQSSLALHASNSLAFAKWRQQLLKGSWCHAFASPFLHNIWTHCRAPGHEGREIFMLMSSPKCAPGHWDVPLLLVSTHAVSWFSSSNLPHAWCVVFA